MSQWVKHQIRVRYQETDQMGVVYHANYLNWFEIGRTEMIRKAGVTYRSLEERNLLLPLIDAELKFKRPAYYDDVVTVYTRIMALAPVSLNFIYEIRRQDKQKPDHEQNTDESLFLRTKEVESPEGELLVLGRTKHAWVNREWKPVRLDKQLPELYELLAHYHQEGG